MDYPERTNFGWHLEKLERRRVFWIKFAASALDGQHDGTEIHLLNDDFTKAIRLAGPCALQFGDEEWLEFDLGSCEPSRLQPFVTLLGKQIETAAIRSDGTLTITFAGPIFLNAFPAEYESWELFDHRYMYCIPGGGVGFAEDTLRVGPGAYEWRLLNIRKSDAEIIADSQ